MSPYCWTISFNIAGDQYISILMNNHTLNTLEYPHVLRQIADFAHGDLAQNAVRALTPFKEQGKLFETQALFDQVLAVYKETDDCPVLEPCDITPVLRQVRRVGCVLAVGDLRVCRNVIRMTGTLAAFLNREAGREKADLMRMKEDLDPLPDLLRQLDKTFDDEGAIQDKASPALADIRQKIKEKEKNIRQTLEGLVRDDEWANVIQEKYVTLRNRRYVIPVKRGAQSQVPGVVHDHSDSGQTLFVEPSSVLPLGNLLSDLYADEEDECRRIRAVLSERVRQSRAAMKKNQDVILSFSVAVAVARWAVKFDCAMPQFGEMLELHGARHPILSQQLETTPGEKKLVPLDLELRPDCRALVITGSNSGGKTVAIKTAGLLTLLAQAGLPVPAHANSRFVMFQEIFADIGDEQSLSESLSTFTGHVRRIGEICRHLDSETNGRALVILDELGTGTDPLEGGALACAVLERLAATNSLTLATTHLGVVKAFVHDNQAMLNAAVRFNAETLKPEYVLDVGKPGASHALNIAARMGVPEDVMEKAGQFMDSDHLHLEQLLDELEENRRRAEEQDNKARQRLTEATRSRNELSTELENIRREKRAILHDAYEQASQIIADARRQTEQLVAQLRDEGANIDRTARETRNEINARAESLDKLTRENRPRPEKPVSVEDLLPGEEVWVEKLQANAVLKAIDSKSGKAKVALDSLEFEVSVQELGVADQTVKKTTTPPPKRVAEHRPRLRKKVSSELNIIGMRVAQALPRVDRFLDEAVLAGLPEVRIVHGYGTGRLQKGIHEHLKKHELVKHFCLGDPEKDSGGRGVTKVRL